MLCWNRFLGYSVATISLVLTLGCSEAGPHSELEQWSLQRELTIGSIDDSDQALTRVGSLAVDAEGTIYLTQPQEHLIRIFSSAGELVRIAGRAGQGPGEFQSMGSLGWLGDSLSIGDFRNQRVSLFSREGTFIRSLNLVSPLIDEVFSPSVPERMLPDGTALVRPSFASNSIDEGTVTARPLFRIDTIGAVILKLAEASVENYQLSIRIGSGALFTSQQFGDAPLLAMPPRGAYAMVVDRTAATEESGGVIWLRKISVEGDTVFTREITYDPVPLPQQVVDSVLDLQAEQIARFPVFGSVREARAALDDRTFVPAFYTPVNQVRIGSDDKIWLKRENTPSPDARWDIISPEGEPLAFVVLPASSTIHESRGDLVWATEHDELDVTYVVRFRLVRE